MSVSARIVTSEHELDTLASEWPALHASSLLFSAPLRFAWLRHWWRIYRNGGPGKNDLNLVTLWRNSTLVGALPLYRRTTEDVFGIRHLRFLSTGEAQCEETCADYLNLLCRPEEESACVEALRDVLRDMAWDHLELLDVPTSSPIVQHPEIFEASGPVRLISRGVCYIANLEGGFEAYLRRLSSETRKKVRRLLREAEKEGVIFELAGAGDVDRFFDDLISLHQQRWISAGEQGCFAAPRFTEFHRTLAREWVPEGKAVLARLSIEGHPVAALYGFVTGAKFDEYQAGVDLTDGRLRSPGILARLPLMQHLCQQGVTTYDFLRGSYVYKERLSTERLPMSAIEVWRPSARAHAYRGSRLAARALAKVGRIIKSRLRGPAKEPDRPAKEPAAD